MDDVYKIKNRINGSSKNHYPFVNMFELVQFVNRDENKFNWHPDIFDGIKFAIPVDPEDSSTVFLSPEGRVIRAPSNGMIAAFSGTVYHSPPDESKNPPGRRWALSFSISHDVSYEEKNRK